MLTGKTRIDLAPSISDNYTVDRSSDLLDSLLYVFVIASHI